MSLVKDAALNIGFIVLQLGMLSIYFSVKNKKWLNIADKYLGWGDILFFICIAFLFSPLNYVAFYIISLVFTILLVFLQKALKLSNNKEIPLAGIQSFLLIILLFLSILLGEIYHPERDTILLNYLISWNIL